MSEFNWGGPPYDGGFMGDLVFFGGFLALGQAPFVAAFVWVMLREAQRSLRSNYTAGTVAVFWTLAGFVGWTFGSAICVSLYSVPDVLAESVRWVALGAAQGVFLAAALIPVASPPGNGEEPQETSASEEESAGRGSATRRARSATFSRVFAAWVAASVVGGLLFESWRATEVAARTNVLENLGLAENVANIMIPYALAVPILYGIPTGLVFSPSVAPLD